MQEEPLRLSNKVELISGFATVVLAICMALFVGYQEAPTTVYEFLPYIAISALVSIGSYLHVVRRNIAGFVIVMLVGGLLGVLGVVGAAVAVASTSRTLTMMLFFLPSLSAFVCLIAAIVTQLKRREGV